jgi:hypothetical protein
MSASFFRTLSRQPVKTLNEELKFLSTRPFGDVQQFFEHLTIPH